MVIAKKRNKRPGSNPVGRTKIPDEKLGDKVRPDGLTRNQYKRMEMEATIRNMKTAAWHRLAIEWVFDSLDNQRGDSDINKIFDDFLQREEAQRKISIIEYL